MGNLAKNRIMPASNLRLTDIDKRSNANADHPKALVLTSANNFILQLPQKSHWINTVFNGEAMDCCSLGCSFI